ncbi:hypothetical protein [Draconibacterium orientale]|uniref:hypothetical protein n=1 Tax=Draconibacterium orientale TaxID=1168034 RepID=UPI002A0A962C|nr:hypothetical protein [Draconibacterium orientale]
MLTCSFFSVYAQVPQKTSYQAVIRDQDNKLVIDAPVGIQISILQGDENGTIFYSESLTVTTNSNGLLSLEIGTGYALFGQFEAINWAQGPYFLKSEVDPQGGFNYTITGTHEILSVPYALHAVTADSIAGLQQLVDSLVQEHPSITLSTIDIENWNNKADSITGTEAVFNGWDKNAADDFSGDYNDLSNTPKNLSNFNNDRGFISSENDPAFNNSAAATITNEDITRWDTNATETDPLFTAWDKNSGISISQSQINDLAIFEKELSEGETTIEVGFSLLPTSSVYINGVVLSSTQWAGTGTTSIVLNLDIELFDKLKIER